MTSPAASRSRRNLRRTAAVAVAGASLLLGGCAVNSPVQTDQPYQPAEGVEANVGSLEIRNLAVVTSAKDAPGALIGQVVNHGEATKLTVTLADGTAVGVEVPAAASVSLSEGATKASVTKVPAAPGMLVEVGLTTPESGQNAVSIPVLKNQGFLADVKIG